MSLVERIRGAAHRRRERFRYEVVRRKMPVAELYEELAPGLEVDLLAPDGFVQLWSAHMQGTPRALWTVTPAAHPQTIEHTRNGEHALLARTLVVTPAMDWHRDPFHGVSWPRVHVESCPYTMPGGDIELLWHLNQMDFLGDYAAAYRTTNDEQFAARAIAFMDSWAQANPYMVGANWISPMKSGIRLFMWSSALAGLNGSLAPENHTAERILRSVQLQAGFLAGHFSNWAIPNNHLIAEAAALAAVSTYWPMFKRARNWMAQADATMAEEVKRQVLKDGFQFENSVNYHMVTLDFLLLYLHAKVVRGESPDALVLEKTMAMAEAALALVAPSGRMPMVGDDSFTHLIVLGGTMGSPGPVARSVSFEDFVRLEHARLFSTTAWGRDLLALHLPVTHTRRFEDAGIDVMRAADCHIVFTHGPQHHRPFSHGHLHADTGSFELELDGAPLIIDSGTYLYGTEPRIRRHMRSARAHNTVLIDGVEPMKPTAAFQWEAVAVGEALGFGTVDDVAATGCKRHLPGLRGAGVDHTRALVRVGSTIIIVDTLSPRVGVGKVAHMATVYFHTTVAPGIAALDGKHVRLTDKARFVRVFEVLDEPRAQIDLIDNPADLAALYSPVYAEAVKGTTIRVSIPVEETVALVCVLRSPEVSVTRAHTRTGHFGCAINETHTRRIVSLRTEPFGVFVGGQAIVGASAPATPRPAARPTDSLAWLDEIEPGLT
jgi:hypothetical protein